MLKHLWEVEHSYYCNEVNYFACRNDSVHEYKSFQDYLNERGDECSDMNLIFRWDWKEEDEDGEVIFNGDDYYRNGKLYIFYMLQRKGAFDSVIIDVCRADEDRVRNFLMPRWELMKEIWEPLCDG